METASLEKIVENHEHRLQELERYRSEQEKVNNDIRLKLSETEKTVLKESGKQQELTRKLLDHVLENDTFSRKQKREERLFRQQQIWKIIALVAGSGGIVYMFVETLLKR